MSLRTIDIDNHCNLESCGYRITRIGTWREHGEYYLFNGEIYEYGVSKRCPPELDGCLPPIPLIFLEKLSEDRMGDYEK